MKRVMCCVGRVTRYVLRVTCYSGKRSVVRCEMRGEGSGGGGHNVAVAEGEQHAQLVEEHLAFVGVWGLGFGVWGWHLALVDAVDLFVL